MKCYIVDDLLPEYIEQLCSPETSNEIDAHIASCKKCRDKLNAMTAKITSGDEGESNSISANSAAKSFNPFLKIQQRMKREKRKKIILIFCIAFLACIFIYFGVVQVFPELDAPVSYEKIIYSVRAKQLANDIINGNNEAILKGINNFVGMKGTVSLDVSKSFSQFYSDTSEKLSELHKEAFPTGNYRVKVDQITYHSFNYYSTTIDTDVPENIGYYETYVTISSADRNIPIIIFFFNKDSYIVTLDTYSKDSLYTEYIDEINYFDYIKFFDATINGSEINSYIVNQALRPGKNVSNSNYDFFDLFCNRFSKDCSIPVVTDGLSEEEMALLKEISPDNDYQYYDLVGCTDYYNQLKSIITEIYLQSETIAFKIDSNEYDTNAKKMSATLYWEINDANGNYAIMIKDFYVGPYGFEAVDNDEAIYADDEFDEKLMQKMADLFDK